MCRANHIDWQVWGKILDASQSFPIDLYLLQKDNLVFVYNYMPN